MIVGFYFRDGGLSWWEKGKHLSRYMEVFKDDKHPHGKGCCLIFTYS